MRIGHHKGFTGNHCDSPLIEVGKFVLGPVCTGLALLLVGMAVIAW